MPERTLELEYPLGGEDRSLAAQRQKPFTTPYAVNVQTEGTIERQLRGGSRPKLIKSFETRVGSGSPVYMAATMRSLAGEERRTFKDDFDTATFLDDWTAMNAADADWAVDGQLTPGPGDKVQVGQTDSGSVLNDGQLTNIEDSNNIINATYTVEVYVSTLPIDRLGHITDIYLYARLDDTNPTEGKSVWMRVRVEHLIDNPFFPRSRVRFYIGQGKASEARFYGTFIDGPLQDGWMRLTIEPRIVTAEWIPGPNSPVTKQVGTEPLSAPLPNESRVGLRVDNTGGIAGSNVVNLDDFVVRYFDASAIEGLPPESFVGASKHDGADASTTAGQGQGSNIWYEQNTGQIVELPSKRDATGAGEETDLNHGVHIMAVDWIGRLYICDHGERQSGTDGTLNNTGTTFDDAADTDWSEATGIGVDGDGDWLEILSTGTGAGATLGVYKITAATAGGVTITPAASSGEEVAIKYRIVRGPKIFDPTATAGSRLTRWVATDGAGTVPIGCTILEIFNNRMVFGGDPNDPHAWYMSRYKDPLDYNYGASFTDRNKAVSNAGASVDLSNVALPITAIVPSVEDYCLFSAESNLAILRGDVNVGGLMGNVSRQIGIGSRTAWCRVPDGSVVFLSRDGLYRYNPSQAEPQSISREKLPDELIDVVQNTDLTVTMEYDVRFQGIRIFIAPTTAGTNTHYWLHWPTQALWSVILGSTDYEPFALTYDAKTNRVLLGCRDGYVRHFDAGAADDDGTAVRSEVDYGPIPLNRGRLATVDSLQITLDDGSDDVDWTFRSGHSPEEAFGASPRAFGTAVAGVNYVQSVRHSGEWGFLRLSTTGAARWSVEAIEMYVLTTPARARKI